MAEHLADLRDNILASYILRYNRHKTTKWTTISQGILISVEDPPQPNNTAYGMISEILVPDSGVQGAECREDHGSCKSGDLTAEYALRQAQDRRRDAEKNINLGGARLL